MRYLIGVKRVITYVFSQNYARIKVDSYYSLPLEKLLTFHNVIIHIKSVLKDTMKACILLFYVFNECSEVQLKELIDY